MICMFVKKTFVHVTDPIQAPPLQTPRAPPPAAPHCESGGRRCWQAGLAGVKATHAGSLDRPIKIQPSACAFHHCGLPRPPSSTSTTCLNLTRQPIAGLFLSQPHPPPTSHLPPPEKVSRPLATFESASPLTSPKLATQPYLRRARSACPLLSSQARSCKC